MIPAFPVSIQKPENLTISVHELFKKVQHLGWTFFVLLLVLFKFVGALRHTGKVEDRTIHFLKEERAMLQSGRKEDERTLGDHVFFSANIEYDLASEIILILWVRAEERDDLISLMHMRFEKRNRFIIFLVYKVHVRAVIPGSI